MKGKVEPIYGDLRGLGEAVVWSRVSSGYVHSGWCSIVSGLCSDASGRGLSGEERAHRRSIF